MWRYGILLAALPIVAAVVFVSNSQPAKDTLWPSSRFTELDRQRSLLRGLEFIYASAKTPKNFVANGDDFLWCFYSLSAAAKDPELKRRAYEMGQDRAREWRRLYPHVPADADADVIGGLAFGSLSAALLDLPDDRLKAELVAVAHKFKAEDYLQFDPTKEPPPSDIPRNCKKCKSSNVRGTKVCKKCGEPLRMNSPYDILCEALISAYTTNQYGVWLGGSYEDVAQWVPKMRPYPRADDKNFRNSHDAAYAITHIVYTLNDYTLYRLKPEWLPEEYQYLRANLKANIQENDPETLGEFMDTLRSFGVDETDPDMRTGVEFLLSHQNPDGSWGNVKEGDSYVRYHTTWTAMNGVMQYQWRGEKVLFPEGLRRMRAGAQ